MSEHKETFGPFDAADYLITFEDVAAYLNDLQVRARVLRVAGDQVLVRVTVSNHGLVAAEAVQIVEASLAGRSALGGLPSRPTHIGAGRRVSRQLWFGAPSKTEGTSGLRVRLVLRDGEHVEMVALSQP